MQDMSLTQALAGRRTRREFSPDAIPRAALQRLLWAACGRSGPDGGLTVPSAHALQPLRLFVSIGRVDEVEPGLYAVDDGSQDLRLHKGEDVRSELQAAALEDQPWIGSAAAIVTVCADLVAATTAFAEQPPYGTRGRRYVHIEAGAAAQNIYLQAAAEDLACVLVAGFHDEATAAALGLAAPLAPVLHMCIGRPAAG